MADLLTITVPLWDAKQNTIYNDLCQQVDALNGALAGIQTERAKAEVGWTAKEQEIKKKIADIEIQKRAIRLLDIKTV